MTYSGALVAYHFFIVDVTVPNICVAAPAVNFIRCRSCFRYFALCQWKAYEIYCRVGLPTPTGWVQDKEGNASLIRIFSNRVVLYYHWAAIKNMVVHTKATH